MKMACRLFAAAAASFLASIASASVITQWNFNGNGAAQRTPSIGAGTLSVVGGASLLTSLSTDNGGSPGDTTAGVNPNHAQGVGGVPFGFGQQTPPSSPPTPSGTNGVRALVNTSGFTDIQFSFHVATGFRASRFYQLYATSDGTNYLPVSGGTGSSAGNLGGTVGDSWYSALGIDNNGLVDIRVNSGKILGATGASFGYELTYTFPSGSAFENNPNFGVMLAAVWDSTANDYVSSFAGTSVVDATTGYSRSSAAGGGLRYDFFTVSGIPEPASMSLLLSATVLCRRRWKQ